MVVIFNLSAALRIVLGCLGRSLPLIQLQVVQFDLSNVSARHSVACCVGPRHDTRRLVVLWGFPLAERTRQ